MIMKWMTVESMFGKRCNVHLVGGAVIVNVLVTKPTKQQYVGKSRTILLTGPEQIMIVPLMAIESMDKVPEWAGGE
jgi:hypothetical protein